MADRLMAAARKPATRKPKPPTTSRAASLARSGKKPSTAKPKALGAFYERYYSAPSATGKGPMERRTYKTAASASQRAKGDKVMDDKYMPPRPPARKSSKSAAKKAGRK